MRRLHYLWHSFWWRSHRRSFFYWATVDPIEFHERIESHWKRLSHHQDGMDANRPKKSESCSDFEQYITDTYSSGGVP